MNPGADSSQSFDVPFLPGYAPFVVAGGRLYFAALEPGTGFELWASDGTEANTVLVKDVQPGSAGSTPWELTALGAWVYFRANDGTHGSELWKTDGTEANTTLVKDVRTGAESGLPVFGPAGFAAMGTKLVFFADDGTHGLEPWRSDGTEAGTTLLADLNPSGPSQYQLHSVMSDRRAVLGGRWYFRAFDEEGDAEVYTSDGTPAGTGQLEEIDDQTSAFDLTYLGLLFGANPLADLNGTLFFQASDGLSGTELWKSDGTEAGTALVRETAPTAFSPTELTPLGNLLLYSGIGPDGAELWKTDGTVAGTVQVKDVAPSGSSWPDRLTLVGNRVFFSADDGSSGRELWVSDGTGPGTSRVKDIAPGAGSGIAMTVDDQAFRFEHWASIAAGGSRLVFPADDGVGHGEELWVSGGTGASTFELVDILPGPRSSEIRWLTSAGHRSYFVADDGTHGRELWVTDGTVAGTRLVADLVPGEGSSLPEQLQVVGPQLLFSASTPDAGREPWVTDGDAVGTYRLADLAPGALPSSPIHFTLSGARVDFAATDGTTGFELYSVPRSEVDGSLDFFTVPPCRLVDTRQFGGPLGSSVPRTFDAAGLCGVPSTAKALAVKVTVTGATAAGDIVLYRGSTARPPTSTIPFAAGQTRANNAMVHLGDGAFTAVSSPEGVSVHLIVDVTGYFE